VQITRVLVFCLSAYLAAIAGALSGPIVGRASSSGFQSFGSLLLLVLILISGRGTIRAPFLAAVFLVLPSYTEGLNFLADYQQILFGLAALGVGLGGAGWSAAAHGPCRRAPGEARGPARTRIMAARAT
jgi:ABC-type branched-subunit amino acid transport system permease subunit